MSDRLLRSQAGLLARRKFLEQSLRGTGVAVALPWLASLPLRADDGKLSRRAPALDGPPIRFGCLFFSNGVEPAHWWAESDGLGGMSLGPGLAPVASQWRDLVFLKGLFNEQAALHPSPHMGRMANLLSGAWISNDQSEIRAGQSIDQVLAGRIGFATELPSLVLGIEPMELRLEDGLSMVYGSCISWASATKPASKEIYPARVYDLIMGNTSRRELDHSILDAVLADAQHVRKQLSAGDRVKLDEYLESVRDIEQRIDRASKSESLEGWRPSSQQPVFGRPPEALPHNIPDHMRLMLDLIVLAFRLDKTRVITCMLNNDLSQMNFGFLEGVQGSLHLDLTHNGRDPKLEAMYLRTNQFHVSQLAYLMEQMRRVPEGDSNLLANSVLMFCSNLFDGDRHEADEMPILLAGGGGGSLNTGRMIDVRQEPTDSRRACSLYLSIAQYMGVELSRFGDATQPLASL